MLKRPHYVTLTLIVLLVVLLLSLPAGFSSRLKVALGSLFLPLFGLASSSHELTDRVVHRLTPQPVLARELEQLRHANEQLRLGAARAEEIERENARLYQLFGFQKAAPWKLKLGRVVGRDPANWWRSLQIDLGSQDGLHADLPVLCADGLVGRVVSVHPGRSQVVLVGDPSCRVSALIKETRDTGVLSPSSAGILDQTIVDLTFLPRASLVKPGHTVTTSGLGGLFPKGIPIGVVVDTWPVESDLYLEARVKVAAHLARLEEVWVLMP